MAFIIFPSLLALILVLGGYYSIEQIGDLIKGGFKSTGPTMRAASVLGMEAGQLWNKLIPIQIFGIVLCLVHAVVYMLICFLCATYRCLNNMLNLIFKSDEDLPHSASSSHWNVNLKISRQTNANSSVNGRANLLWKNTSKS